MPAPSNKKKTGKHTISQTAKPSTATTAPNEANLAFDFAFFIENANEDDIFNFLDTAATTYKGQNLKLLFLHVYRGGKDAGYWEGREVGYQEGEENGYNSGYSEGYVKGWNYDEEAAMDEFHQFIGKSHTESPILAQDPIPIIHVDLSTQMDNLQLQTYTREEIQILVDKVHLKGWQTGFEDGWKKWYAACTDSATQTIPHIVAVTESGTQTSPSHHHTSTAMAKKLNICNEKHPEMLENTPQHPPQPLATYHNPTLLKKNHPHWSLHQNQCYTRHLHPQFTQNTPEHARMFLFIPKNLKHPCSITTNGFFPQEVPQWPPVTTTSPNAPQPAVILPSACLNWADDTEGLALFPNNWQRDISCLSSGTLRPFDSIQKQAHHHWTWHQAHHWHQPWSRNPPPLIWYHQPAAFIPPVLSSLPPKINWSTHPWLLDLSWALQALGIW